MKKKRKILFVYIIIILLLFSFTSCKKKGEVIPDDQKPNSIESTEESEKKEKSFSMKVLDVGQGLCILIECDGHWMIYDGGGHASSSYVVSTLKKNSIETLDYMIVSHYDEDHISGLVGVMNTTPIKQIICPDYVTDSEIYDSFINKQKGNNIPSESPTAGQDYFLGSAQIQILSPENFEWPDDNNNSIAIRIIYGEFSCIITGDAEYEAEKVMLDSNLTLDSDVYVAGHHGSSTSSSEEFVNAISPKYALISVGENSYGHPTEEALSILEDHNCIILRTDLNGTITVTVDQNFLDVDYETNSFISEQEESTEKVDKSTTTEGSETTTSEYILNNNTMKFHWPSCKSVKQMSEHNKTYSAGMTRDEIIESGYDPCQNCNP